MKDRCNSVDVALSGEPRKFFVSCEFFFCVFFSILHLTSSRNIVFISSPSSRNIVFISNKKLMPFFVLFFPWDQSYEL